MGEKYVKVRDVSWPVRGKEASEYERLGWGLVRENDKAFGQNTEEAVDRLLEKYASREVNK